MPASRLYYRGTSIEVCLGDRVRIRRWVRAYLSGVVCYIPGISPPHAEFEYDDVRQWAIRADNGSVYSILYAPETFQPPGHIVFVERGDAGVLLPDEHLE